MLVRIHPKEPEDPALLVNTRLGYLYRDAANWKKWTEAVVAGRPTEEELAMIMDSLDDGENFVPSKIGLPENRFDTVNPDDGPWFEINTESFVPTAAEPDLAIDVHEIARRFAAAKGHWLEGSAWTT